MTDAGAPCAGVDTEPFGEQRYGVGPGVHEDVVIDAEGRRSEGPRHPSEVGQGCDDHHGEGLGVQAGAVKAEPSSQDLFDGLVARVDDAFADERLDLRESVAVVFENADEVALGVELGEEPAADQERLGPDVCTGQPIHLSAPVFDHGQMRLDGGFEERLFGREVVVERSPSGLETRGGFDVSDRRLPVGLPSRPPAR